MIIRLKLIHNYKEIMRQISKVFTNFCLGFLLLLSGYKSTAVRQNSFKINTDLTASVIDNEGPNSGSSIASNYNASKSQQIPIDQSRANETSNGATANAKHICTREETYVEQLQIPNMQPVRVRTSSWCLEFPPRCSNYKTEMRQVMQVKNVTKTRTIRFCCDGYEASTISLNDTVCKPVCRGGCGRGRCETPGVCTCDAGYIGKHCTQRCDHDHWGLECKNECQCQNGAACDNKSGLCHCITGWTGVYCEQPCPPGTHGVMCRKACECASKYCHPQTGACEESPANVTHVMIATLNSTIANITHNLDRLAKNIVNITPPAKKPLSNDETILLSEDAAIPTNTLPEVIVIKQDETEHTPKIIVHQQGSGPAVLETLHNGAPKPSEIIHFITGGWPNITHDNSGLHLAGIGGATSISDDKKFSEGNITNITEHDSNVLSTILIILLIILIAIALGFLYVYRRYHTQKAQIEAALASRNIIDNNGIMETGEVNSGSLGKSFLKPLPDLPAFTQMMRNKIEAHEYYDSPQSSNLSVQTPPYNYARKESLYSIVAPKSRRGSQDSHLYDEIRYPSAAAHHHHHHQHQLLHHSKHHHTHHDLSHSEQSEQQLQHSTLATHKPVSHHVTQLIIPPQNSKFLQVPHTTYTTHRIAHM